VWLFCSLRAAMADGVRKTVAFLATYVEELVRLQKPGLEAVLKSNRAKQVKEWKAKKKCLVTTLSGVGDNHDCYDF
jgi:hypothetical protein